MLDVPNNGKVRVCGTRAGIYMGLKSSSKRSQHQSQRLRFSTLGPACILDLEANLTLESALYMFHVCFYLNVNKVQVSFQTGQQAEVSLFQVSCPSPSEDKSELYYSGIRSVDSVLNVK